MLTPTVVLGDSFLAALSGLPGKINKKTRELITKFQQNPKSPGLNYESINAGDKRLHSLRVDQTYRVIVLKSDKGSAYIFLWVDKHDEAYAWARGRKCGVNPTTGAIQVVDVNEVSATLTSEPAQQASPQPEKSKSPALFHSFTDADLEGIGATAEMIPLIRSLQELDDLESIEQRVPPSVYEPLLMLGIGENYDSVRSELGIVPDGSFDEEDFESALELGQNQQHFLAITDDAELEAILNAPMAKWRVFLHPSQRKLVKATFNGPARVLGGAGTGKTVVAMHRARQLASMCRENERLLFTTFTKSLTQDIKVNLQKICNYDEIKKIDVKHIDLWCHDFLNKQNLRWEIAYGNHPVRKKLWEQALAANEESSLSDEFLREEWDKVIQYHDLEGFADYARVPRAGRNSRLTRLQRKRIWPVFEEYQNLLIENQLWEPADMFRAARQLIDSKGLQTGYKHIIADEVQDLHPQALRLLRAMIPKDQFKQNDLFLVGDGHQNLYGHHIVLSQLGIDIRGRGRRLKINYRTPEETRKWAASILDGTKTSDLDGELDSTKGYVSLMTGPDPKLFSAKTFEEEVGCIASWVKEIKEADATKVICITAQSKQELESLAKALPKHGVVDLLAITSDNHDKDDPAPIRLITHHRIKGLEFDHVCISGCSKQKWNSLSEDRQLSARYLLHVAATRTKNSLLVTAIGSAYSPFENQ